MNREAAHKIYFGFVFLVFVAKYFFSEYLFHLSSVPLLNNKPNWLLQLFTDVKLTELTINTNLAIGFHILLLINCVFAFKKANNILFPIINSTLLLVYFIIYNGFNPSQNHTLIILLVLSFCFWTNKQNTFTILIDGARYFIIYHLSSAGVFKLINGGFWYPYQFTTILKHQHIYELTHSTGIYNSFIQALLANPIPTELIYRVAVLLQLTFVIGFFTKKYDWILSICFFSFFIGDLIFMKLSFYESYIGLLCFINHKTVEKFRIQTLN